MQNRNTTRILATCLVAALLLLGLSAFATVAGMLSLLIFVGEAVRDAFDPRRTFA